MLKIAYRADAATLSRVSLMAWCTSVSIAGLSSVVAPGVVATLTPPSLPWSFERQVEADDRTTLGGQLFSRVRYQARSGIWIFADVPEAEVVDWRAWYSATLGGRLPFVIEFRETLHVVTAAGLFPLAMIRPGKWGGQLGIKEVLA